MEPHMEPVARGPSPSAEATQSQTPESAQRCVCGDWCVPALQVPLVHSKPLFKSTPSVHTGTGHPQWSSLHLSARRAPLHTAHRWPVCLRYANCSRLS